MRRAPPENAGVVSPPFVLIWLGGTLCRCRPMKNASVRILLRSFLKTSLFSLHCDQSKSRNKRQCYIVHEHLGARFQNYTFQRFPDTADCRYLGLGARGNRLQTSFIVRAIVSSVQISRFEFRSKNFSLNNTDSPLKTASQSNNTLVTFVFIYPV